MSIHPLTIRVMGKIGIDVSDRRRKGVYEYLGRLPVRVAISVCPKAEDKCPTLWPGATAGAAEVGVWRVFPKPVAFGALIPLVEETVGTDG